MNTTAPPMTARVYHDAISRRAREIWHARHHPAGSDVKIWLEAERELVAAGMIPSSPPMTAKPANINRIAADEIDEFKVLRRLSDFGEQSARSATSLGVSHSTSSGLPFD